MNLGLEQLQSSIDKIAKLPNYYRLAVIAIAPIAIIGLAYQTVYSPSKVELKKLEGKQQTLQRKLNEVRSVAGNLDAFEEELQKLEKELKVAVRQLPSSKELPGLLTDITTVAKDAGLELETFKPMPEVRHGFYAEVPIDLSFKGEFHDVATFFDRIAGLPRIVNIGKLRMAIDKESVGETSLKVTGTATTFRFLEGRS